MAPILINCAASLASDLIDGISDKMAASSAQTANSSTAAAGTDFATTLANVQQTPAVRAAALADQQAALTSSLMASPEITSALATADPSKGAQLEIGPSGSVGVRNASGTLKPVNLTDKTRALVTQLYGMRQPAASPGMAPGLNGPSLVLAVDPTHASTPLWSTLPARS